MRNNSNSSTKKRRCILGLCSPLMPLRPTNYRHHPWKPQLLVDTYHQLSCKFKSWISIIFCQCPGDHPFTPFYEDKDGASLTTPYRYLSNKFKELTLHTVTAKFQHWSDNFHGIRSLINPSLWAIRSLYLLTLSLLNFNFFYFFHHNLEPPISMDLSNVIRGYFSMKRIQDSEEHLRASLEKNLLSMAGVASFLSHYPNFYFYFYFLFHI